MQRRHFDDTIFEKFDFICGRHLDIETIERAGLIATGWEVPTHEVLLSLGWITAEDYTNSLAQILNVASIFSIAPGPIYDGGIPAINIDATSAPPATVARRVQAASAQGKYVVLYSSFRPQVLLSHADRVEQAKLAVSLLRNTAPIASASRPHPLWQKITGICIIGVFVGAALIDTRLTYFVLTLTVAVPFFFIVNQRVLTLATHIIYRRPKLRIPSSRISASDLPIYSVLVPLYEEAEILPDLVDALSRIDYPAAKLDVILILEDIDTRTRNVAERVGLPGFMRVVSVPNMMPRTKPKALNYALRYARGEFIAVYDAEDIPEPQQLQDAVKAFARYPDLDCLQARLNIYNGSHGWLTGQFALEYTALFDGLLPALERLRIPLPLGGTSNHFRREALAHLGGWDPFNVTEDADLGIRLSRSGGQVGVLNSTTWEEAPQTLANWLPQRTRWIKGWMQTYLVHMRAPLRLRRELGLWGFLTFQCLIGGFLMSALLHPFLYVIIAIELSAEMPFKSGPSAVEYFLWHLAMYNLVAGYLTAMIFAALTAIQRGRLLLALTTPLMPAYWLLSSIAAYRAVYQLFAAPHHWEKTRHARRTSSARPGTVVNLTA